MKSPKLIAMVASLALGLPTIAAPIIGVTATADSTFNTAVPNGTYAARLVDNSGLSTPVDFASTHEARDGSQNMWHSAVGVTSNTNVNFNLNGTYNLQTIYIWQHNQSGSDHTNRGVQSFDILVSTDGGASYTEVQSNLVLAQSPTPPVRVAAQSFPLVQNGVTHVRLHIDSNYGGVVVGLSEVKFDTVPNDPDLEIVPTYSFGSIDSTQTSQASIFVTNTGATEALAISSVIATGFDGSFFVVNSFPATLEPGATGAIIVTFDPDGVLGLFQSALQITSNKGGIVGTISEVALTAESLIIPDPELVAPANFNFSSTLPTETRQAQIPISNSGTTQVLEIESVTIIGPQEASFTVNSFPETLAASGAGTITVTFNPANVTGDFTATLVVTSNAGGFGGTETNIQITARAQTPTGFSIIPLSNATGGVPFSTTQASNPADVINDPFPYADDLDPAIPAPDQFWPTGLFLANNTPADNAFWQVEFSGKHRVERLDVWGRRDYQGAEAERHQTLRIEFFLGGWDAENKVGEIPSWSGVTANNTLPIPPSFGSLVPASEGLTEIQRTADRMRITQATPGVYLLLAEVRALGIPLIAQTLRVISVTHTESPLEFTFAWESKPGATYTVRRTGDLTLPRASWEVRTSSLVSGGATTTYTEAPPAATPRMFYIAEEN